MLSHSTMRSFSSLMRPSPLLSSFASSSISSSLRACAAISSPSSSSPFLIPSRSYMNRGNVQIQKRTFKGIWAGKHIHFGNNVSHSERKTRRTWSPNVHYKMLHSQVLQRSMKMHVTTNAIRTFDKFGGLDRYLLRTPLHRLDDGVTKELRTDMELKLIDFPNIAADLHLGDVIARLNRPHEVRRLRAIVESRRAIAIDARLWYHPHVKQVLPDGVPKLVQVLSDAEANQAAITASAFTAAIAAKKVASNDALIAAHAAAGTPIMPPRNVATVPFVARVKGGGEKYVRSGSYEHPFTQPLQKHNVTEEERTRIRIIQVRKVAPKRKVFPQPRVRTIVQ